MNQNGKQTPGDGKGRKHFKIWRHLSGNCWMGLEVRSADKTGVGGQQSASLDPQPSSCCFCIIALARFLSAPLNSIEFDAAVKEVNYALKGSNTLAKSLCPLPLAINGEFSGGTSLSTRALTTVFAIWDFAPRAPCTAFAFQFLTLSGKACTQPSARMKGSLMPPDCLSGIKWSYPHQVTAGVKILIIFVSDFHWWKHDHEHFVLCRVKRRRGQVFVMPCGKYGPLWGWHGNWLEATNSM